MFQLITNQNKRLLNNNNYFIKIMIYVSMIVFVHGQKLLKRSEQRFNHYRRHKNHI